jgi:medium-chain acyl-[acyl-carrier-protein] hydrolase
MKIQFTKSIRYDEVDAAFAIGLGRLLRLLQEAAVRHSEAVGIGSRRLVADGTVWVLNRLEVRIDHLPQYREAVTVDTWHKGSNGFKARRDFVIRSDRGRLVSAASLWLYYDLNRRRIVRIPEPLTRQYTIESDEALSITIDHWKPDKALAPESRTDITVRSCDFDPLGHVNNACYFDYLETALTAMAGGDRPVRHLRIEFQKEIGRDVAAVTAGLRAVDGGFAFQLGSDGRRHAVGDIRMAGDGDQRRGSLR